ncbi:Chaperone protein [Salix suchowensis]|nr:Chaperone protein [Salix suchowensis]
MGGPASSSSSSSSSEEEDANWKAAIESIAATTTFVNKVLSSSSNGSTSLSAPTTEAYGENTQNSQKLKHYQIKAQKCLDIILERTLEMVRDPIPVSDNDRDANDVGVRLFKRSPAGIVFDHLDEIQGPRKRPRILPGHGIDEKSKKFRHLIQSIAVDGAVIISEARDAEKKSLAQLEAKEAAAKAKAKKEAERVVELKQIRGERWLPSIAREMQKCWQQQLEERRTIVSSWWP